MRFVNASCPIQPSSSAVSSSTSTFTSVQTSSPCPVPTTVQVTHTYTATMAYCPSTEIKGVSSLSSSQTIKGVSSLSSSQTIKGVSSLSSSQTITPSSSLTTSPAALHSPSSEGMRGRIFTFRSFMIGTPATWHRITFCVVEKTKPSYVKSPRNIFRTAMFNAN